ncbi:hypothetical protein RIF29_41414 [Crotalaria pallida]|uniref:Uncharacterized protein n=1 Tax=Crotalaria pallida TaxID=3830 RepID=A0AAN9E5J3_CROPI
MNGGRPCKRARIDLNAVSCSKVGNNLDELVSSSNQRMHALFGDDQNINVRRFAQGFGFGDSSGDALKSMDREFADVECDIGKNSNVFDLNSIPESSCINNGNQFERSEMDEVNVRSTFEVRSSSRCQTECDLANDEGHAFEFNELDEDDEHVLSDNEFCEDDDDLFDEGEPCLEMTSVDYHGVGYSDLGDCDFSCRYCGAKFWFKEKVNPKQT